MSTTTKPKYGIRITFEKGQVGWIVGTDGDVMLFPDKSAAAGALKNLKSGDHYSWSCETEVAEFTGWGR